MPEPSRATSVRWPVPIALAVPALAAAILITFTPGHTVWFGYAVFAGFALLTAVGAAIGGALLPPGPTRTGAFGKTIVAAVGAIVALVLGLLSAFTPVAAVGAGDVVEGAPWAQAALGLSLTIAITLAALAVIDLVVGIRLRRSDRFARDWITVGVIEAAAALAVVVVPPTFFQAFSFTERSGEVVSGAVTASTMMIGLFGAAAAVLGVLLVIAGIGLVPQRDRQERAAA